MNRHVIYHRGCSDGFTSAWLLHKKFPDANFVAALHGEPLPEGLEKEDDVIIADFSYPRDVTIELASKVNTVTILDHHKTAEADLVDLPDNVTALFDMERSGAKIVYDYLKPKDEHDYWLVEYIQDRDLWTWELEFSEEVGAYIQATEYTFENWDKLADDVYDLTPAIKAGEAILMRDKKVIKEILATARPTKIAGYEVLVVGSPYVYGSTVAGELAKEVSFGVYYVDKPDGRQFGLRSSGDFDVSEIAQQFGGGGHKNAAGFTVPWDHELAGVL